MFYFDALYGSNKGTVQRGTRTFDARTGPDHAYHYTDEVIEGETLGVGTGAVAQFAGNLSYTPVRPATVEITDGTQTATDNGNGALIGDVNALGNNTVNYSTGAYDVTFAAVSANGATVTVNYEYDCAPGQCKLAA